MLTRCQLNSLRTAQALAFDQVATVLRNTPARDAGGGVLTQFTAVGAPVPCRAWIGRPAQQGIDGGAVKVVIFWKVLLPWNADVREDDRLQIGTKLLRVSGTDAGHSDALNLLAICDEVD